MKALKILILTLAMIGVTSCGPRNAIGLVTLGGVSQQINITEQDANLTTSRVTIKFDGKVVDQSLLSDWTTEAQNFGLNSIYKDVEVEGRTLRVRREHRAGIASTTVTYQFFENNRIVASVPIAF